MYTYHNNLITIHSIELARKKIQNNMLFQLRLISILASCIILLIVGVVSSNVVAKDDDDGGVSSIWSNEERKQQQRGRLLITKNEVSYN